MILYVYMYVNVAGVSDPLCASHHFNPDISEIWWNFQVQLYELTTI